MIELIREWLKTKDYIIGVEIYRREGSNAYLKSLFSEGPDTYNVSKLEAELRALLHKPAVVTEEVAKPRSIAYSEALKVTRPSDSAEAPGPIKEAVSKRRSLYARARSNHDRLVELFIEDSTDFKYHARLNLELLDAWDEIKEIWDLTNFYDKNLRLPKAPKNVAQYATFDTTQLNKLWMTNYKYIRKNFTLKKKAEEIQNRSEANSAIESTLRKRDAFHHEGLKVPTPE